MILYTAIQNELGDGEREIVAYGFGTIFMQKVLRKVIADAKQEMSNLAGDNFEMIGREHMRIKATIDVWEDVLLASEQMSNQVTDIVPE